jgi:hypothetical protein
MSVRHAGITAPGPGAMVDHQHPLGNGCVGCWWPNAAVDAGRGLWIPDLSGHGQHGLLVGAPTWTTYHPGVWALYMSPIAAQWVKIARGPACDIGLQDFSVMVGLLTVGSYYEHAYIMDCRAAIQTYGWAWDYHNLHKAAHLELNDADRALITMILSEAGHSLSSWNIMAITVDRDGAVTEWKNGKSIGATSISAYAAQDVRAAADGYLRWGCYVNETTRYKLGGTYEFAYVWNRALSAEEVAWLYREPAAMIWEPGRKRTFLFGTVAGLTAELADTATGADSIAALLACTATLADDGTGADSLDAKAAFAAALVDTATGSDDLSATAAYLVSMADNAAGADALEALYAATVLLAEDGTGADTLAALKTLLVELSDAAGGSDALSASLSAIATLDDTVEGTDTLGAVAAYLATLADGAEGSDALSLLAAVAGIRHVLTIRDKRKVTTIRDLREALTISDKRDVTTLK